jgi:S-adenosylmethionine/arginine decarboxylase-like enzyme|tara:strand:+ start:278 stop:652 length:375 start_codon:yes stop_codon:yes gene_type:complete
MLVHQHLIVRGEVNKPLQSTDETLLFLQKIIHKLNMKAMFGPVAEYCHKIGNRGVTGFAIIETSHIAIHVWDESSPALVQLDIYSCSNIDLQKIFKFFTSELDPIKMDYKYLDRETDLINIPIA